MERIVFILGLLALLGHTGCHSEKEGKEEGTKFLVTHPLRKDTQITREYVCQIHALQHIEIRALEKGYLQQIFCRRRTVGTQG